MSTCVVSDRTTRFSVRHRDTIIAEQHIYLIWQMQIFRRNGLITEDGRKIIIAFPGMLNLEKGPDFISAEVYIDGKLHRGDIEIHIFTGDWYRHRHYDDVNYSNVILHIAMWRDNEEIFIGNIPQLILEPYIEGSIAELLGNLGQKYGFGKRYSQPASLGDFLDEAGERRFFQKASRYKRLIELLPPEEVLYRGIMESLGYKNNKAQFYELAKRVSYGYLSEVAEHHSVEIRRERIEEALLCCAGFVKRRVSESSMIRVDIECWRVGGGRPANHPVRRIKGISGFLARSMGEGIINFFSRRLFAFEVEDIGAKINAEHICRNIIGDFTMADSIGKERGLLMLFNVILPFLYSYSEDSKGRSLIFALYNKRKPLSANIITNRMEELLSCKDVNSQVINSVKRQMGLIQLYKEWF